MPWHFVVTPPADGPANMAFDEALMVRARRVGTPVFRVYGWSAPAISLGRNQRARGCYDLDAADARGIAFVRRPTGGRALLHHREVTYAAALPCDGPAAAARTYHLINEVLLRALRALGVPAKRAAASTAVPPGLRPCFDVPSAHEIVVGDRKLVGSAQWRHDGVLLQHGSILVHDDQRLIGDVLVAPDAATPAASTIADALGREPDPVELEARLRLALAEVTADTVHDLPPDQLLGDEAARLRAVYASDAWTWRR